MPKLPYDNFEVSKRPHKGVCSVSGVETDVFDFTWVGKSGKEHTFEVSEQYLPMYTKGLTYKQCSV
jgi:hypothetical protein